MCARSMGCLRKWRRRVRPMPILTTGLRLPPGQCCRCHRCGPGTDRFAPPHPARLVGRSLLESCDAKEMLGYAHSGFSVDAGVRIEPHDRAALERLLRYCARPPFAIDRLRKEGGPVPLDGVGPRYRQRPRRRRHQAAVRRFTRGPRPRQDPGQRLGRHARRRHDR